MSRTQPTFYKSESDKSLIMSDLQIDQYRPFWHYLDTGLIRIQCRYRSVLFQAQIKALYRLESHHKSGLILHEKSMNLYQYCIRPVSR